MKITYLSPAVNTTRVWSQYGLAQASQAVVANLDLTRDITLVLDGNTLTSVQMHPSATVFFVDQSHNYSVNMALSVPEVQYGSPTNVISNAAVSLNYSQNVYVSGTVNNSQVINQTLSQQATIVASNQTLEATQLNTSFATSSQMSIPNIFFQSANSTIAVTCVNITDESDGRVLTGGSGC